MSGTEAQAAGSGYFERLRRKGLSYWLAVVVIIVVCTAGSDYVYRQLHLQMFRSAVFQWLLDHGPRPPEPKYVKIALIDDNEFWEGDPAGRRPIKRLYLKKLVEHLVAAKAYVIALDFDLRTPNPASTQIPEDYEDETLQLVKTIVTAAGNGTKFVLATPIFYNGKGYQQDADPYQAYGLCKPNDSPIPKEKEIGDLARAIKDTRNKTITCGYIYLPSDPLVIPSRIQLLDKTELDSFALAVARAGWPDLESVINLGSRIRYSNFIPQKKLTDAHILFSASAVLGKGKKEDVDLVTLALHARPAAVIVGGSWSAYALKRGPLVDQHPTPVGAIAGAVLWANFAEAILDSRLYLFVPSEVLRALEIAFSVIAAIIFALSETIMRKIASLVLLCLSLLIIQWVALHGFAIFFDAFVPLLGLALHSLSERLIGIHQQRREVA